VLSFPFWQHLRDRELSSLRVDQSARCPVRELAILELAYLRVVQLPTLQALVKYYRYVFSCLLHLGGSTRVWWHGGATGKAFGLVINRSQVQILLDVMLRNNLGQVVYTYVPLSPSSITWYRPKGGDAVRLGR